LSTAALKFVALEMWPLVFSHNHDLSLSKKSLIDLMMKKIATKIMQSAELIVMI